MVPGMALIFRKPGSGCGRTDDDMIGQYCNGCAS
jgi:hypothetical protein